MPTTDVIVRLKQAMEAHDLDVVLGCFSDDAVLISPITSRIVFRGHEELRELMNVHFAVILGVEYAEHELVYTATAGGQDVEVVNRLEINDNGLIEKLTVYVRPLPGLVAMAAALGPPLAAQRRSRAHAVALRLSLTPLAFVLALGDRLTPRFA